MQAGLLIGAPSPAIRSLRTKNFSLYAKKRGFLEDRDMNGQNCAVTLETQMRRIRTRFRGLHIATNALTVEEDWL